MLGTVTRYNRVEAWGFILPDDETLPDYFVIPKFIISKPPFLMPGWRVEFTPVEEDGNYRAHDVRVIAKTITRQTSGDGGAL
jgi:cold shock CspA family protein